MYGQSILTLVIGKDLSTATDLDADFVLLAIVKPKMDQKSPTIIMIEPIKIPYLYFLYIPHLPSVIAESLLL